MKGDNFFHKVKVGLAVETQSVGQSATATGVTIDTPWIHGRQLSFLLVGGDHGAAATATCKVQARQISDAQWVTLKEADGTTDLGFTAANLADTAALEDGTLLGTIDMGFLNGDVYDAVRLLYVRGAEAVSALVGAAYIISDLYGHASGTVDDLFPKTQPA